MMAAAKAPGSPGIVARTRWQWTCATDVRQAPPTAFGGGGGKHQHRCTGIADRADLAKPRHALEVEAAGFNRALRRGKMGGHGDTQAGFGRNPPPLLTVQGNAHPLRCLGGGAEPVQPHLVQRQAHRIRLRAVDDHHTAFDRTIVPKIEFGCGQAARLGARQDQPAEDQRQTQKQRPPQTLPEAPGQRGAKQCEQPPQ